MADNAARFIELTVSIVSAYVSNNSVPSGELPTLIGQVHTALTRVSGAHSERLGNGHKPAITAKRSSTPDYLICREDGKKFKSLRRHLRTHYNLTPQQYREKWGLSSDSPMVAPNYAAARSRLAKQMGLGQQRPQVAARRIEHFAFGQVRSQTGPESGVKAAQRTDTLLRLRQFFRS